MARGQDQARWEARAREQGKHRVSLWLSTEALAVLDARVRAEGLRGRAQALERLLTDGGSARAPRGPTAPREDETGKTGVDAAADAGDVVDRPNPAPAAAASSLGLSVPSYRRRHGHAPGGRAAWVIVVADRAVGYAWRDGRDWVAASAYGLVPHWYRRRTLRDAIEAMLKLERPHEREHRGI